MNGQLINIAKGSWIGSRPTVINNDVDNYKTSAKIKFIVTDLLIKTNWDNPQAGFIYGLFLTSFYLARQYI